MPRRSRTTQSCLAILLFCACFHQPLAGCQTPNSNIAPSEDSQTFLQKEKDVRHAFLLRHPTTLPGSLAKFTSKESEDNLFLLGFANVMSGIAQAPQSTAPIPSYWQRRFAVMIKQVPFAGGHLHDVYLAAGEASRANRDGAALNEHALESLRTLQSLAVAAGVTDDASFNAAAPAEKVTYILAGLKIFYGSIEYPCPFTEYLLDVDKLSEENPNRRIARKYIDSQDSDDSPSFSSSSREQQTAALARAFALFTEHGIAVVNTGSVNQLNHYLSAIHFHLEREGGKWTLFDSQQEPQSDADVIRSMFGDEALHRFEAEPESPAKDKTRIAAIILSTHIEYVASGLLAG